MLMHLGTNDVAQDYNLATAPDRLNSLISDIAAISPDTHVIVAQIITSTSATEAAQIDAYNAAIPTIVTSQQAAGHNVTMVDMNSVVSTSQFADTYHPNDAGYDALADEWFTAVEALGEINNPTPLAPAGYDDVGPLRNTSFDQVFSDRALTAPVALTAEKWYGFDTEAGTNALATGAPDTGPLPIYVEGWHAEQANTTLYSGLIHTYTTDDLFNVGETDGVCLAVRVMESAGSDRTFRQYLEQTLTADTDYTLSVEVGHRADQAFPTRDGVVVELLAGETVLAAGDSVTLLPGKGDFETWTFTFDADDLLANYADLFGQNLSIRLGTRVVGTSLTTWVFFDNVSLESVAIPEPTTLAVLGLGGAALLRRRSGLSFFE